MKNQIKRFLYLQRQLSNIIEEWLTERVLREKDLKLDELREILISRIDDAISALKEGR